MEKPWSPAYGKTVTNVLGAGGTSEDDLNPDGNETGPRTLRVYNSGANLMFFAILKKTGGAIGVGGVVGVPLGPGHTIYVNFASDDRFLVAKSTAGTTFYATPGNGGNNGGN